MSYKYILENVSANSNIDVLWDSYKLNFERIYDPDEDAERFEIFKKEVDRIIEHNIAKGELSYALKITEFADRKPGERKTGLLDDPEAQLENVSADSNLDEIWPVYKNKYKRKYEPDEDVERFEIFKKRIIDHSEKNENCEDSCTLKITAFSDRKPEELKELSESQLENVTADSNVDELWVAYKEKYQKNYEPDEDAKRFAVFKPEVKRVIKHNESKINEFADTESKTALPEDESDVH